MEYVLHATLLLPFLGFLVSLIIPAHREKLISQTVFLTTSATVLAVWLAISTWIWSGFASVNIADLTIYNNKGYIFFIDLYFDRITAAYLLVGSSLTFMVAIYSRYNLHRESGYKRFFNTILFFQMGYNITVLAGNFETLFVGWEILGISSFLLIAFYRTRYMPVKNALKVFTIYRIGDVGLLLAMWMSHHFWHENITFLRLTDYAQVDAHLQQHSAIGIFISLMILLAATAKSAQLPFSAWLPRAMEGPTPSSAIFYGSLSVHIGAFLLMRTFSFWEHQTSVRILIGVIGLATALITGQIARVQSTVKSQIAYSSASQIGIIFIEIAAGFEVLALIHFAGNAFLRSYQLLISPSTVAYLIREQFYHFQLIEPKKQSAQLKRWQYTFYLLSLKEWNLEPLVFKLFLNPIKKLRKPLAFITLKNFVSFFVPIYIVGFYLAYVNRPMDGYLKGGLAIVLAFMALAMVVKSYNERTSARLAWLLIIGAHFFIDLAVTFNDTFDLGETIVYLSGVIVSGIVGYLVLNRILHREQLHMIHLNGFHGFVNKYRTLAFLFLVACLGLAGFPITPTFVGEDVILTHVNEEQVLLALLIAITFIVNGIALLRIYARVFLGPHPQKFSEPQDITA